MTIREFFESKEKLAIHCDTEEKAIALLKAFDMAGYRWKNGEGYTEHTCWFFCKNTCYGNDGSYCDWVAYKSYDFKIIEFEEIDLEQPEHIEGKDKPHWAAVADYMEKSIELLKDAKIKCTIRETDLTDKGNLEELFSNKEDGVYILKDMRAMVFDVIVIENGELKQGDMLDVLRVIQECIRLLSVDGSNTKQQVKEMLERLVDGDE